MKSMNKQNGFYACKRTASYDDRERPYFIEDQVRKSRWLRNYRGSGYDEEHLLPCPGEFVGLLRVCLWTRHFINHFFVNIVSNLNLMQVVLEWLEQQVRYWCKKYGDLYIMTGGV